MPQKKIKASDVIGNSYYIYTLTSSNNTPSLNGTINITCKVTDVYGQNVTGKSITLYQNSTSQGAKTTDSNGNASWNNISMTSAGLQVFRVENSKIEVFVDNKSDVGHTHSGYVSATKVTSWQSTPSNSNVPSEKLVKDSLDGKADSTHTHSQYLTEHQSLSNYYNKSETNNYDVDFILGTQTTSTSAWTGTTDVISSLREGTTIFYKLPYASTSTSVTLNLTLKGGETTGAKNVFYKNTTRVTTHYGVGQVVGLTYDGTAWYVISPSDNNNNSDNNYGGIQFKAGEALTTQTICCAKVDGMYYKVANGVVLDTRYPLLMTSSDVASGTTTNVMYRTWYAVNIANTKSMTLTNGSQLFLEGTAYSDGKFTISSNVVTHTLTNGRYYIKVGTALSTTQIRFISDMTVYYYDGTTLKPVIKKEQIVDFPTSMTPSSHTHGNLQNDGQVGSTAQASKNVVTDSSGKITTEDKPTIPSPSSSAPLGLNPTNSGVVGTSTNYARADHKHSHTSFTADGTSGQTGYVKVFQMKVTSTYQDRPIHFHVLQRGAKTIANVTIKFKNVNGNDPDIDSIRHSGFDNEYYVYKESTSTWSFIALKTEAYDNIAILDLKTSNGAISFTPLNTHITTVPSGAIQSTHIVGDIPFGTDEGTVAEGNHTHKNTVKTEITGGSLDNYTTTGWYSYNTTNSSSITNTPENVGSVMEVLDDYGDGKYIVQKVYPIKSDKYPRIYIRIKYASGGWGDWNQIIGTDDASSTTPSADTQSGSYGSGTSYARSNHSHPKSSLYAESTHTHTVSNITDFPSIPSSSSDLSDGSDLIKKSSTNGLIKNNGTIDTNSYLTTGSASSTYQPKLTSGTNIKTINNESLLGSGNISISAGSNVTVDDNLSSSSTNPVQNKVINSALDNKIDKGNIQGGVNLLGQWLSYTNAGAGAVLTQQNNVLFHGDEVVRINNSSVSDTTKYTDMYWETPYTEFGYNDVLTFSFYAKGTNNAQIKTYFYGERGYITVKRLSSNSTVSGNDTEYSGFNDGNTTFALGSDWQFYTVTYKLNSTGTTTAIKKPVIRVFGGTDCYVSCAKLERGFNATDFNNGTGIKSIKIEATSERTKDLNNYTKTGFYYNNLNTDCAYISNLPVSNKAFFLTVENWGASTQYLKQTCTVYFPVETYVRVKNSGTWGAWKKLISVDDASSSKGLADDPTNGLVGTSTKYAREDHAHGKLYHWSTGGVSTATYVDLLEFTMTTSWQDIPITFVVRRRAKDRAYYVSIRFSNTDISTSTYSVTSFKHWGDVTAQTFYLRKVADNTYRLCAYKTANDIYYIDDVVNFNSGITITKIPSADGNYGTTAPSGSAPNLYSSTQIGVPDTDITWKGVATSNSVSPILMATGEDFNANRLAYFPSGRISVQFSIDGGSTWSTYSAIGTENKQRLCMNGYTAYLGANSTTDRTKNRLRITFDVGDLNSNSVLYMITRKIAVYTGTNNATGFTCQLQTQTYAQYNSNVETFSNYGSSFTLGGNSGWNTYPISFTLGGNSGSQTNSSSTRIKALRLVFTQTGGTGNGLVSRIRLYGETAYRTPSNYSVNGHIYYADVNQNAVFPSKIIKEGGTSSQFLMANGDTKEVDIVDWDNLVFVDKDDDSSGSIILNFLE